MNIHICLKISAVITGLLICFNAVVCGQQPYLSPTRMVVHPVTKDVFVLLSTAHAIARVNPATEQLLETFKINFEPSGIAVAPDGSVLFVTEHAAKGKVHVLSALTGKTTGVIAVGAYPSTVCVNHQGTQLWVANRFSNDVSLIDLKKQKEIKRLPVVREPKSLALSPDGKWLVVGNHLPNQSALDETVSAQITWIDAEHAGIHCHIPLPDGAQSVEDVCFSKDGNWVFVTHLLSRYHLPTTHLERGWMNTNALSILATGSQKRYATVLLDDVFQGAANPCGMALSDDGYHLYIAVSGKHELITLDLSQLKLKLTNLKPEAIPSLATDFVFLYDLKKRLPLQGKGAGYVAVSNQKVFVSDYFSGGLSVVNPLKNNELRFVQLGDEPEPDAVRKGELFFADAMMCYQHWQSCISCHPGARADGLNWDLMNDGIGNPKNTKSMLYSHVTPPAMITGIRPTAEYAVRSGIRLIQFSERPEEDAKCIDLYLSSLRHLPSPFLQNGKLSKLARKGKQIYEKAGCADCHNGEYLTDGLKYDVGTGVGDYQNVPFDTPTIKEVWRTAPYLYNGCAKTMQEVLTIYNKEDKHGKTSHLSDMEIEALTEYVLSL